MALYKTFYFEDEGVPATGLTLSWTTYKNVSDGTNHTPTPTFSEVGGGWYKITFSLTPFQHIVGVVDGGAGLSDADRYQQVELKYSDFTNEQNISAVCNYGYDENTDSITFIVGLMLNGSLMQSGVSNVQLDVYKDDGSFQFSVNTGTFANGFASLVKNDPNLIANTLYAIKITFTTSDATLVTADSFMVLQ